MCPKAYSVKKTMIKHFRRRHGFKGTETNIKEFYTRLDPRECNLGLDEETMTNIFGPPNTRVDEVLVGDFVTLTDLEQRKRLEVQRDDSENTGDTTHNEKSQSDDEISRESQKDRGSIEKEEKKIVIKIEPQDDGSEHGDNELEPTDFVSVKIEPMDDDDGDNE